jgi:hypothetical protein
MQNIGQIMQEVDGQSYCIAVSRIWENKSAVAGGMTRETNAYVTIKKHKKNWEPPTGCGHNIDEERRMRLNLQVMAGIKEGSRAYGKMQHEHQMEIEVLIRAPMIGRKYRTSYNMQKEWLSSELAKFEPKAYCWQYGQLIMQSRKCREKPIPICQVRNTYLKSSGCHHIRKKFHRIM